MSYTLLNEAWKREKENQKLQPLEKDFYSKLSQYIKNQHEEIQMLDEKTLKASLLSEENERIKKLLTDLVWSRYQKILKKVFEGKTITTDLLTSEEEIIYNGAASTWKHVENVVRDILKGKPPRFPEEKLVMKPKRILVRFLQAIPAIVGPDMNTYGPFKEEDIASLPAENAEILVKRNVAVEIEA